MKVESEFVIPQALKTYLDSEWYAKQVNRILELGDNGGWVPTVNIIDNAGRFLNYFIVVGDDVHRVEEITNEQLQSPEAAFAAMLLVGWSEKRRTKVIVTSFYRVIDKKLSYLSNAIVSFADVMAIAN